MSDAYKNFAAVLDILEEHDVPVVGVDHEQDYSHGDSMAEFEVTVMVPVFEQEEYTDE